MSKIKTAEGEKEIIHTTLNAKIYNDILLPFSDNTTSLNVVLETALVIACELCKQNNIMINNSSLRKIKDEIISGRNKFIDKIVIEIDPSSGKTIFFIPDKSAEFAKTLLRLAESKVFESTPLIIAKERGEGKENDFSENLEITEKIMAILAEKKQMFQKDIRIKLGSTHQAVSIALQKLEDGGIIKKEKIGKLYLITKI